MSLFSWFYTTVTGQHQQILGLYNAASTAFRNEFVLKITNSDTLVARTGDGSSATAATASASPTTSAWQSGLAVFAAANDRRIYLNGANKGTDAGTKTPSGIDRTSVGVQDNASGDEPFAPSGTGYIAFPTIWNVDLTDAEAAALGAGIPPWSIRPASLVACWPMLGDSDAGELNWWPGAYALTETGTVGVGTSNPPVALPFPWMRNSLPENIAGAPPAATTLPPSMLIGL